jgi:hypothetical protein
LNPGVQTWTVEGDLLLKKKKKEDKRGGEGRQREQLPITSLNNFHKGMFF